MRFDFIFNSDITHDRPSGAILPYDRHTSSLRILHSKISLPPSLNSRASKISLKGNGADPSRSVQNLPHTSSHLSTGFYGKKLAHDASSSLSSEPTKVSPLISDNGVGSHSSVRSEDTRLRVPILVDSSAHFYSVLANSTSTLSARVLKDSIESKSSGISKGCSGKIANGVSDHFAAELDDSSIRNSSSGLAESSMIMNSRVLQEVHSFVGSDVGFGVAKDSSNLLRQRGAVSDQLDSKRTDLQASKGNPSTDLQNSGVDVCSFFV